MGKKDNCFCTLAKIGTFMGGLGTLFIGAAALWAGSQTGNVLTEVTNIKEGRRSLQQNWSKYIAEISIEKTPEEFRENLDRSIQEGGLYMDEKSKNDLISKFENKLDTSILSSLIQEKLQISAPDLFF